MDSSTHLAIAESDAKTLVASIRLTPGNAVHLDTVRSAVVRFGLHPIQATVNELVFSLGQSTPRMSRTLYAHVCMIVMYFRRAYQVGAYSNLVDGCNLFEELITQHLVSWKWAHNLFYQKGMHAKIVSCC
jgi:hypothetical protein